MAFGREIGFDYLYGYVGGDRFMVSSTVEQICAFIMKHRYESVKIVNFFDEMEIETSMGMIMFCRNQEFLRDELIPSLAPMQQGEKDVPEFVPHTPVEDYVIPEVRLHSNAGHFLGAMSFEEGFPEVNNRATGYYASEEDVLKDYPDSISQSDAIKEAIEKGWMTE